MKKHKLCTCCSKREKLENNEKCAPCHNIALDLMRLDFMLQMGPSPANSKVIKEIKEKLLKYPEITEYLEITK